MNTFVKFSNFMTGDWVFDAPFCPGVYTMIALEGGLLLPSSRVQGVVLGDVFG